MKTIVVFRPKRYWLFFMTMKVFRKYQSPSISFIYTHLKQDCQTWPKICLNFESLACEADIKAFIPVRCILQKIKVNALYVRCTEFEVSYSRCKLRSSIENGIIDFVNNLKGEGFIYKKRKQ